MLIKVLEIKGMEGKEELKFIMREINGTETNLPKNPGEFHPDKAMLFPFWSISRIWG